MNDGCDSRTAREGTRTLNTLEADARFGPSSSEILSGLSCFQVPAHREHGFTYAAVLVAIVLMGILAGVANMSTSRIVQADLEEELLFRGMEYRSAIQRYYAVAKHYPRSLDELLKDPRVGHRAHLRALYIDPIAQMHGELNENGGWRLVRAADGGIAGVASQSRHEPMKIANFPPGFEKFDGARSYAEWIFEYAPNSSSAGKSGAGSALGNAGAK